MILHTPLPSVLEALIKTGVTINGLLIPGRQAPNNLQRFCRPVCFYNKGSPYELSSAGACFLFRYRAHRLAFFTKHQLVNSHNSRDPSEFCILVDGPQGAKIAVTPDETARPTFAAEGLQFAEDIQFVAYDEKRAGQDLSPHFVDVGLDELPDLRGIPTDRLVVMFAIGYPSASASFDFDIDDDGLPQNLSVAYRFSKLVLANDWSQGMEFHLTLHQHEQYSEPIADLDGFSGGPVFFFYRQDDRRVGLGFAGMVRLAANGIVHVYEAAEMKRMLAKGFP